MPWIKQPTLRHPPSFSRVAPDVAINFWEMLRDEVVEHASSKIFLSRAFTVPKKNSSATRQVVDFSCLNCIVLIFRFKMLMARQVRMALRWGSWFTVVGLESTGMSLSTLVFCKFLVVHVGQDTCQFSVTLWTIVLYIALRVFSKLTKVVVQKLAVEDCLRYARGRWPRSMWLWQRLNIPLSAAFGIFLEGQDIDSACCGPSTEGSGPIVICGV